MADDKLAVLETVLSSMGSVLLAFSGGCDSTLLLKAMAGTLPRDRFLAVIADSPIFPSAELAEARRLAAEMGAEHLVRETCELDDPGFTKNEPDRCHVCKLGMFQELKTIAGERSLEWLADGTNLDDMTEGRPSMPALDEMGVRHPLAEAGLTKPEIRELSRAMGLETWDKPGRPCYASRISFGIEVTRERIDRVSLAEEYLASLGFERPVVRYHAEEMARLKLQPDEAARATVPAIREDIVGRMKGLGFDLVVIDIGALP